MNIAAVIPMKDRTLHVVFEDGNEGVFDITPYLNSPAFKPLEQWDEFSKVQNGRYYVSWPSGADLSADTLVSRLQELELER